MTKEEKVKFKIERRIERRQKKKDITIKHKTNNAWKKDCPFDVDMNGLYGTCTCGGINYESCCGDI
jgi:hypothetical protein